MLFFKKRKSAESASWNFPENSPSGTPTCDSPYEVLVTHHSESGTLTCLCPAVSQENLLASFLSLKKPEGALGESGEGYKADANDTVVGLTLGSSQRCWEIFISNQFDYSINQISLQSHWHFP